MQQRASCKAAATTNLVSLCVYSNEPGLREAGTPGTPRAPSNNTEGPIHQHGWLRTVIIHNRIGSYYLYVTNDDDSTERQEGTEEANYK